MSTKLIAQARPRGRKQSRRGTFGLSQRDAVNRLSVARPTRIAIAVGLAGLAFAGAVLASTTGWKVQPSPNPSGFSEFYGVAATSRTNAWAVGGYCAGDCNRTLIAHWNGKVWKVQPSPNPYRRWSWISAVAATSSTNAWTVGYTNRPIGGGLYGDQSLVEHWNGKAWKVQPSPNTKRFTDLNGVAATSRTNAWAVGSSNQNGNKTNALVEHWNGKAWKIQKSPNVGGLSAVTATSATNAWAVGGSAILHWNGKAWKIQPSPKHSGSLKGVAATSATNAWAVGHKLIEHWNGKTWKVQPSPKDSGSLKGVAATSATNAWAVGVLESCRSFGPNSQPSPGFASRIVHWNGRAWKLQNSPNPSGVGCSSYNALNGVAAVSSSDAWAVGGDNVSSLILHWDGGR